MPKEKADCPFAYRKAGSNATHCKVQAEKGGKWDFCKYQYFCRNTGRYELTDEVGKCGLRLTL